MKIAFIVPGLDPTGPIIVVKNLISSLVKLGHNVVLYYLKPRPSEMSFDCDVRLINKNSINELKEYEIIHSHCISADRFVYKNRRLLGTAKWVTTIHQDTIASFEFSYPLVIAKLIGKYWLNIQNKSDAVVAISNQIKDTYQSYIKNGICTIYNGICTEISEKDKNKRQQIKFEIKKLKQQNKRIVGTYANIVKRKGLDQVLECMLINNSFDFVIIGEGDYKKEFQLRVEKFKLTERVHFFPFVTSPFDCLDDVDIYVMPSFSEGFGLALIESASVGKPIVCSNLSSFHELFTSEEVEYFNINDINGLSSALNRAFLYKDELSQKSKLKALSFSNKKMAENYTNLYSELINN